MLYGAAATLIQKKKDKLRMSINNAALLSKVHLKILYTDSPWTM
jgi:hypothetical protein